METELDLHNWRYFNMLIHILFCMIISNAPFHKIVFRITMRLPKAEINLNTSDYQRGKVLQMLKSEIGLNKHHVYSKLIGLNTTGWWFYLRFKCQLNFPTFTDVVQSCLYETMRYSILGNIFSKYKLQHNNTRTGEFLPDLLNLYPLCFYFRFSSSALLWFLNTNIDTVCFQFLSLSTLVSAQTVESARIKLPEEFHTLSNCQSLDLESLLCCLQC